MFADVISPIWDLEKVSICKVVARRECATKNKNTPRRRRERFLLVCDWLNTDRSTETWIRRSDRNTLYIVLLHKIRLENECRRRSRTSRNITSNRITISRSHRIKKTRDQRIKTTERNKRDLWTKNNQQTATALPVTLDWIRGKTTKTASCHD